MYYLMLHGLEERAHFIKLMKERGVGTVFHYIPLHSSPAGRRLGRPAANDLAQTDRASDCLVRMPLWVGLDQQLDIVTTLATEVLRGRAPAGTSAREILVGDASARQ
jgi:dTDP-4-amino-4,6-dideoxygalactose transaminase